MANDFELKCKRIRKWLNNRSYEALLLTSQASFSWLTGGRGFIGLASVDSCGKILVSQNQVCLITNNIEANRLRNEEINHLPIEIVSYPWYDEKGEQNALRDCSKQVRIVWENELPEEIRSLRQPLTELERERYLSLGKDAGEAIEEICQSIKRGDTEYQASATLSAKCMEKEIEPILTLVAGDARISQYRHPLPTSHSIDNYALLALGARRHGLVVSVTRLVHFGDIPETLVRRSRDVAMVDAIMIAETRPDVKVSQIFEKACAAYSSLGYPNEWELHHQGGLTGYQSREFRATLESRETVGLHQAFAWNPSITGVKSEDTIFVEEVGNRLLTRTGEFPEIELEISGTHISRPAILRRQW